MVRKTSLTRASKPYRVTFTVDCDKLGTAEAVRDMLLVFALEKHLNDSSNLDLVKTQCGESNTTDELSDCDDQEDVERAETYHCHYDIGAEGVTPRRN